MTTPAANPLLAQLKPLHTPQPPGWWPPAPGWWLLATLLLLALGYGAYHLYRRYRANAYRRQAAAELAQLLQQPQTLSPFLELIRRTAKTAHPKSQWPALTNPALLTALDQWSGGHLATDLKASGDAGNGEDLLHQLALSAYQPGDRTLSAQQQAIVGNHVRRWIKKHQGKEHLTKELGAGECGTGGSPC